ncbi:MAG: hypothetical protein HY560_08935 [Gemmatimonadetes bacterium]|nr:hypothetical protein [Gemmatimonadota bacterium]
MNPVARLVVPALRWRASTGYRHEGLRIEAALKLGVGGFIIFGGEAEALRQLTADLQAASSHPLLIGSDLERGGGQQLEGLTHLPAPATLGFLNAPAMVRRCAEITALEALSVGVNWVYAPNADLDIEPRNPIVQTRSFGDDPERVGNLVSAWIAAAEAYGVVTTAKHYPGHGRTTSDSHDSLPQVSASLAELEAADLRPFAAAVSAGCRAVMTAHVAYPAWDASGAPATLSPPVLRYLRDEMKFAGVTVTDALIMEGALRGGSEGRASVEAVTAGCDALLYPRRPAAVVQALDRAATSSNAKAAIDGALGRVGRLAEPTPHSSGTIDLDEHRRFSNALADLTIHALRGDSLNLVAPLDPVIVDDDVGGPYLVGPRDLFTKALKAAGVGAGRGGSRVVLVYSEPRSWKGRAFLGRRSLAALARHAPGAALVILFGHPRLLPQISGSAPVVCAWHGQPLMQEAAARWVVGRLR